MSMAVATRDTFGNVVATVVISRPRAAGQRGQGSEDQDHERPG
ncbi:hypothetical protein [Saccharopolyspora hattusasensis]